MLLVLSSFFKKRVLVESGEPLENSGMGDPTPPASGLRSRSGGVASSGDGPANLRRGLRTGTPSAGPFAERRFSIAVPLSVWRCGQREEAVVESAQVSRGHDDGDATFWGSGVS